jgi:hypothetical protein
MEGDKSGNGKSGEGDKKRINIFVAISKKSAQIRLIRVIRVLFINHLDVVLSYE